ncbi:hypothetical protein EDD17DRAFT_737785 [Pisolithus thermaeus]|nr:hypothetical protein EDD17DRAFT_737785 [Pisolithus thermaeus]
MRPWGEQTDELVRKGSYARTLALLITPDTTALLHKYDDAINTFELDFNLTKVVIAISVKMRGQNRRVLFPSKLAGVHVVVSLRNGTSCTPNSSTSHGPLPTRSPVRPTFTRSVSRMA